MLNRWLASLERRYARYAFTNITFALVAAMAVMFVLLLTSPGLIHWMTLDREQVLHGQLWRLVTFAFLPPSMSPIWIVFSLFWLYTMGVMIEQTWGSFRYQIYLFLGWLGSVIVGMASGVATTNAMMLASVTLAFATLFPDYEVRVFFVLPVKVKWFGWLIALGLLAAVGASEGVARLYPAIAVANYLLFFAVDLVDMLKGYGRRAERARAYGAFQQTVRSSSPVASRVCAACGVTDADPSIDFRVCSCDKCQKPTTFCLEHARKH